MHELKGKSTVGITIQGQKVSILCFFLTLCKELENALSEMEKIVAEN